MKSFKQLLAEVAQPKSEDELNFKDKHMVQVTKHPVAFDHQHTGEIEGGKKSKTRVADYEEGEDEDVYEETELSEIQKNWGSSKGHSVKTSKGTFGAFSTSFNPQRYDIRMTHDASGKRLPAAEGRKKFAAYNVGFEKDAVEYLDNLKKKHDGVSEEFDLDESNVTNKMLAVGRRLQAMAPKEKNDMLSNAMARLADHIENFGTPFGPRNIDELAKKSRVPVDVAKALIKKASVNESIELDEAKRKEMPRPRFAILLNKYGLYHSGDKTKEGHTEFSRKDGKFVGVSGQSGKWHSNGKSGSLYDDSLETHLKGMKESVELDEISDKLKGRYLDKAVKQRDDFFREPWDPKKEPKWATPKGKPKKGYYDQPHKIKAREKDARRGAIIDKTAEKLTGKPHYSRMSTSTTPGQEGNAAAWWKGKKYAKESVDLDEAKSDVYHQHMLKALGKTRLPKNHSFTSAIADNGDFIVRDGGGRVVGRIAKGEHSLKESPFIAKAAYTKAKGEKKFKLGDKEYPVTIKKDTADKITEETDAIWMVTWKQKNTGNDGREYMDSTQFHKTEREARLHKGKLKYDPNVLRNSATMKKVKSRDIGEEVELDEISVGKLHAYKKQAYKKIDTADDPDYKREFGANLASKKLKQKTGSANPGIVKRSLAKLKGEEVELDENLGDLAKAAIIGGIGAKAFDKRYGEHVRERMPKDKKDPLHRFLDTKDKKAHHKYNIASAERSLKRASKPDTIDRLTKKKAQHQDALKNTSYFRNIFKKESTELSENFKTGSVKLDDGSSVLLKKQDADLLNQMFKDLNATNRREMMKVAMKDKDGFNEILGFAREAL
jgi:hypothetical protein